MLNPFLKVGILNFSMEAPIGVPNTPEDFIQTALDKYKVLQSELNLPKLDELQKTFNLELDFFEDSIVDHVRNEMADAIFDFSEKIIEPLITAENFCCEFEQKMLSKKEMDDIFELYKKVQALKWENNTLAIKNNEKQSAEFINKMWELWKNDFEKKLSSLCNTLSVGWQNLKISEGNVKDNELYMG